MSRTLPLQNTLIQDETKTDEIKADEIKRNAARSAVDPWKEEWSEDRKLHERWLAANTKYQSWSQAVVRYVVMGNAGAAAALIAFLGIARPPGGMPGSFTMALILFILGFLAAGVVIFAQWAVAATDVQDNSAMALIKALPGKARELATMNIGSIALTSLTSLALGMVFSAIGLMVIKYGV